MDSVQCRNEHAEYQGSCQESSSSEGSGRQQFWRHHAAAGDDEGEEAEGKQETEGLSMTRWISSSIICFTSSGGQNKTNGHGKENEEPKFSIH